MNERDFTLIDDYFNGLLPPEQAQEVLLRAANDPAFAKEFSLREKMEAWPRREAQQKAFAETLNAVGADFFKEENKGRVAGPMTARMTGRRWVAIAASLALLAAAVWFFTLPGEPSYQAYADHKPLSLTVRGASEEAAGTAEKAFNAKNYAVALSALDQLLITQPDNLRAQLYKGICLIELGRPSEARSTLEPLANGSSALQSEAQWYIALSYLREKNKAACREALLQIPQGESHYQAAQKLLEDLD